MYATLPLQACREVTSATWTMTSKLQVRNIAVAPKSTHIRIETIMNKIDTEKKQ